MDDILKVILYPQKGNSYTENEIKEVVCKTIREHIKNNNYEFNVEDYYFDLRPDKLSVAYKTDDTVVMISNDEIHFESTRKVPKMYFVISKEAKDEYSKERNHLEIEGTIKQFDNTNTEQYTFTLYSTKNDNVKRYLQLGDGFQFVEKSLNALDKATVERNLKKDDKFPNFLSFFNTNSIRPVILKDDSFITTNLEKKDTYGDLLPELKHEKNLIRIMYSTIIEFYDDYIKNA